MEEAVASLHDLEAALENLTEKEYADSARKCQENWERT